MSNVTCHVSGVTCLISLFFIFLQRGGTSQWRVCYQLGLPRLVFKQQIISNSGHIVIQASAVLWFQQLDPRGLALTVATSGY